MFSPAGGVTILSANGSIASAARLGATGPPFPELGLDGGAGIGLRRRRALGGRKIEKEIIMLRVSSLRLAGAAALLFAAAAPAHAAGDAPLNTQAQAPSDQASDTAAAPAEAARPAAPEERKICRMIDSSESRLGGKKVCMTAAQWKKAEF
jgi:hypothetical protein